MIRRFRIFARAAPDTRSQLRAEETVTVGDAHSLARVDTSPTVTPLSTPDRGSGRKPRSRPRDVIDRAVESLLEGPPPTE